MIYLQFLVGLIVYSSTAFLSYSSFKSSNYSFLVSACLSALSAMAWLSIARNTPESGTLVRLGLAWDAMLTFCYIAVPFLFFNPNVSKTQILGIAVTLVGLFLARG